MLVELFSVELSYTENRILKVILVIISQSGAYGQVSCKQSLSVNCCQYSHTNSP